MTGRVGLLQFGMIRLGRMIILLTALLLSGAPFRVSGTGVGRERVHRIRLPDPANYARDPQIYDVIQVLNESGRTEGYRMHLVTDVCFDRTCKIMEVTLTWDADGNYRSLETPENAPLTRINHTPFEPADYRRLDRILRDKRSVLGIYPMNMFVTAVSSNDLDGFSGATRKELSGAVVEGAAYSTWILWNWVNGDMVRELMRLTGEKEL